MVPADFNPIRTKSDTQALADGCYFDPAQADRPVQFIERLCRLSKGQWSGQQIKLIPWQLDMLWLAYGWRRSDGTRRFRVCYTQISKKCGKSSLLSSLALFHLIADGEPGAEVYSGAVNRAQASIVFDEAKQMVRKSPALAAKLKIVDSTKRIIHEDSASVFRALSAEISAHEGLNASACIIDELHKHKSPALLNTLRFAGIARRQPITWIITTAGRDRNSCCYAQYEYAKAILKGSIIDTEYLPTIYEIADEDAWDDPRIWHKANPALGEIIKLEDLQKDCEKAKLDPVFREEFIQVRLDRWMTSSRSWLDPDHWQACAGPVDIPEGAEVWAGLDLSSTEDITALVIVYVDTGGNYHLHPIFWCPRLAAERTNRSHGVPYLAWADQGHIILTEGDLIDFDVVEQTIQDLSDKWNIRSIWIDRWNHTQISTRLTNRGFVVRPTSQGVAMNDPTKQLERLITGHKVRHGGHPVLNWMSNNAVTTTDSQGNKWVVREKSKGKIDGIVGSIMGVGASMSDEATVANEAYADRGMLWF